MKRYTPNGVTGDNIINICPNSSSAPKATVAIPQMSTILLGLKLEIVLLALWTKKSI